MDAHKYVAGNKPVLVVGRHTDLPKVDRYGNYLPLSKEEQLAEMELMAERQAIDCGCEECSDWL